MRASALALAVMLVAVVAGCAHRPSRGDTSNAVRTASGAPLRIVVLGDSLALGIGASDSSRGFAFDLFRRARVLRPRAEMTDFAVGGATSADALRLEVPRLRGAGAEIVFVETGGNDAVRQTSPARFARTYAALLAAVRANAPRARIVAFDVPDVSVSPIFDTASRPRLHRLVVAYDVAVAAAARANGASVADLYTVSQRARRPGGGFFSGDLFHPSDAGYAALAAAAWPTVARAIAATR